MAVANSWLLLSFSIASKPSAPRLYIWRKLKRLGALLLHNAVWVLPPNARTREQFQWLAAEIIEMGGEATLWEAQMGLAGQAEMLKQQFVAQAEAAYQEILQALHNGDDPATLSQRYQQIRLADYFQSPLGEQVRAALLAARGGKPNEMGHLGERRRGSDGVRLAHQTLHRPASRVSVRGRRRKDAPQGR